MTEYGKVVTKSIGDQSSTVPNARANLPSEFSGEFGFSKTAM